MKGLIAMAMACSLWPACMVDEEGAGDLDVPDAETEAATMTDCAPISEDAENYDDLRKIEDMGYCASSALDQGEYYVVENDIRIDKTMFDEEPQTAPGLATDAPLAMSEEAPLMAWTEHPDGNGSQTLYSGNISFFTTEYTGCTFGVPKYIVDWSVSSCSLDHYELQYKIGSVDTYHTIYTGTAPSQLYSAQPGRNYLRVRARCTNGTYTAYRTTSFQAVTCGTNPPPPN